MNLCKRIVAVSAIILLPTSRSEAIEFRVPTGTTAELASVTENDVIRFSVARNRSYCAEIFVNQTSGSITFTGFVGTNVAGATFTTSGRGEVSPRLADIAVFANDNQQRLCFRLTAQNTLVATAAALLTVDTTTNGALANVSVRTYDTTLFGGFNTSVTDFNFLELTNTQSSNSADSGTISGTIIGRNAITDQVVLQQDFTVLAGDRFDINIHDVVGPGAYGTLTVIHNGIPSALRGVVSQYRIVSTTPFDFEPVLQQQLVEGAGSQ